MSSYENSSLTEIEAVLDGLEEATSTEVFDATRPYSPRAIAAVAASRADTGGGNGESPVQVLGPFAVAFNAANLIDPADNGHEVVGLTIPAGSVARVFAVQTAVWTGSAEGDELYLLAALSAADTDISNVAVYGLQPNPAGLSDGLALEFAPLILGGFGLSQMLAPTVTAKIFAAIYLTAGPITAGSMNIYAIVYTPA